jgi:hypothetical protein
MVEAAHDNPAYGRNVVDVGFLHHGAHGMLHRSIGKLVVGVLFPDLLQVEVRTVHLRFQELQVSRVRHRVRRVIEVYMAG